MRKFRGRIANLGHKIIDGHQTKRNQNAPKAGQQQDDWCFAAPSIAEFSCFER